MNLLPQLIADVIAVLDCQGHGSRAKLAAWLQVRPQKLNDWLKGKTAPNGEHTLQLRTWLDGKPSKEPTECPLKSISTAISSTANDWSKDHREAWIYGIANGWTPEALRQIADSFQWKPDLVERLARLRKSYLELQS